MTDRELIDAAAKAAGRCLHKNTRDEHGNWGTDTFCTDCGKSTYGESWRPLTSDADALRLAVTLKIDLRFGTQKPTVMAALPKSLLIVEEVIDGDPWGSTRLAIVRAAALMAEPIVGLSRSAEAK